MIARSLAPWALLSGILSCAPIAQPPRTVEPVSVGPEANSGFIASEQSGPTVADDAVTQAPLSPAANSASEAESAGREPADQAEQPAADREFVQSRAPKKPTQDDAQSLPIHLNDAWWPFRAQFLGLTIEQAKRRDQQISTSHAPKDFWDEQTAVETVSVWSVLCNECHGGRRSVEDALAMPPSAPTWGQGEGLFFGNRRAYRHAFDIVYNGGPEQNGVRSEMIAWKRELSREQIWALLYFLEYQSGGIEGRFPPSLYPRRPDAISGM